MDEIRWILKKRRWTTLYHLRRLKPKSPWKAKGKIKLSRGYLPTQDYWKLMDTSKNEVRIRFCNLLLHKFYYNSKSTFQIDFLTKLYSPKRLNTRKKSGKGLPCPNWVAFQNLWCPLSVTIYYDESIMITNYTSTTQLIVLQLWRSVACLRWQWSAGKKELRKAVWPYLESRGSQKGSKLQWTKQMDEAILTFCKSRPYIPNFIPSR